MTRSTFDELCDAVGPLVTPAKSCPREPVPTDKWIMWPVNLKKSVLNAVVRNIPFSNCPTLCERKNILRDVGGFFFFLKLTCFH